MLPFWRYTRGGDSSVVRAPDSWSKGRGFESLQERRENFLLQGQLSVLTLISVSAPPPCYRSPRSPVPVKDPGHSAKSIGGRLQLNTHTPYLCGSAWNDMLHGCMVYTELAEMAAVSCGTSHASAVSTSGGYSKTRYKKLFTHVESHASAVSLFESGE